jgi:RNA polymerase sigma-32 factor
MTAARKPPGKTRPAKAGTKTPTSGKGREKRAATAEEPPRDSSASSTEGSSEDDDAITPIVSLDDDPEILESEVLDADFSDDAPSGGSGDIEVTADDSLPVPATAEAPSIPSTDSLARYLSEIRHYPLLSREEEHEIALRYFHHQDADAAVKLVTSNLRLVVIVAREYQRAFHNLLDLIQEGNVGLLEAVKQFDPYRGVRFPSYAVWWIRAYVIRYVMNNFRLVKVGTTQAQRRLFFNLKKERNRLEALGFTPSAKQIAESLNVKEKEVIEMDQRLATSSEVSVETPLSHDGGAGTMLDLLPAPGSSAEEDVSEGEFYALMKEKIEEFGARLKGREAEIYKERLIAEDPLTLQELGDRYGVSRERVRQMEAAVKKKLREFIVSEVRDLDEDMVR